MVYLGLGPPANLDFRAFPGIQWSRGGASVAKYVQGSQGFMQITPPDKVRGEALP